VIVELVIGLELCPGLLNPSVTLHGGAALGKVYLMDGEAALRTGQVGGELDSTVPEGRSA
jgi:hypothetical protein